jgi:hypothetical protein
MKFRAAMLGAILLSGFTTVQSAPPSSGRALMPVAAESTPEHFMSVTAENGYEWIEQCEWPAQKSDSMTRIAACLSFLQGARLMAAGRMGGNCPVEFANQSRGTLLTTTYQIARRYPRLPINKIFRIAFDSVEPGSC